MNLLIGKVNLFDEFDNHLKNMYFDPRSISLQMNISYLFSMSHMYQMVSESKLHFPKHKLCLHYNQFLLLLVSKYLIILKQVMEGLFQ